MNDYLKMKTKHQEEINNLPLFFAFSSKQLEEGMQKAGLNITDTDKICKMPGGGFCKKTDVKLIASTFYKHIEEVTEALRSDTIGDGFIKDMFEYELDNHEYSYTGDITDTINALNLSVEDILNTPNLLKGLKLAGGRI